MTTSATSHSGPSENSTTIRQIAALNPTLIPDRSGPHGPDHIEPGWQLKLPEAATDHGTQTHATGTVTSATTPPRTTPSTPSSAVPQPGSTTSTPSDVLVAPSSRTCSPAIEPGDTTGVVRASSRTGRAIAGVALGQRGPFRLAGNSVAQRRYIEPTSAAQHHRRTRRRRPPPTTAPRTPPSPPACSAVSPASA